ncbi:MAG: site-specific DNA-methyltransferase [Chloroflexi bacterium]|nr:site-specific DNA-methyltransferase [Chloroflexota bacterium]
MTILPGLEPALENAAVTDRYTVHLGDCLSYMRGLPTDSVDMVFADPPFNLNKNYASYKDNLPLHQYLDWTYQWLEESIRVLKPTGSIFVYNIPKLLTFTAAKLNELAIFRHWIAWNSGGRPLGKTLQPAHYGILLYSKTKDMKFYDVRAPHKRCRVCKEFHTDYGGKEHLRHPFGYLVSDVWDDLHRIRHRKRRIENHPCRLPVPLLERMILMTTDENDVILDPFCGSGTAAVAAMQLGRRYLGVDIDPQYFAATHEKLQNSHPVQENGAYCSIYLNKIVSIRDVDCERLDAIA